MFDGVADDILIIVQAVDLEMVVHVDYSGLDARWGGSEDTVTVIDDLLMSFVRGITADDLVTVTDDVITEIVLTLNVEDAVLVEDELSFANVFNLSFADDVVVADAGLLSSGNGIAPSDAVMVDDVVGWEIGPAFAEFLFPTDEVEISFVSVLNLADSVTVTDDFSRVSELVVNDVVVATDLFLQGDLSWPNVTLLIHGDGPVNGNNVIHRDASAARSVVVRSGVPAQGSVTPHRKGWSTFFDGASVLFFSGTPSFGTGDFTVEYWFNCANTTGGQSAGSGAALGGWVTWINGLTEIRWTASGGHLIIAAVPNLGVGKWHHLAVVRQAGTTKMYLDGVMVGQAADPNNYTIGGVGIGNWTAPVSSPFTGEISNFRLTRMAVYTADFSPAGPLTPILNCVLLACHANRFKDDSPFASGVSFLAGNPAVIGCAVFPEPPVKGGSIRLDGASYLTHSGVPAIAVGTSDFTLEFWFYATSGVAQVLADWRPSGTNGAYHAISHDPASNGLIYYVNTAARITFALPLHNSWHHVAVSRVAGVTRMALDGVINAQVYADATAYLQPADRPTIGANGSNAGSNILTGFITDLHVQRGIGLYTSNFTPPTSPPTPTPYTIMLETQENAAIEDTARRSNIDTVGTTKCTMTKTKFGLPTIEFDGSASPLTCRDVDIAFGTGDFTVEGWVNFDTVSGDRVLFDGRPASTNGHYAFIFLTGGQIVYYSNSAVRITGNTPVINQWYHVAVVRIAGVTKLYIDGVKTGADYADANVYPSSPRVLLGYGSFATGPLDGAMFDIRVTKGIGRYSANFAPPTKLLEDGPAGPLITDHYIPHGDAATATDGTTASKVWFLNAADSVTASDLLATSPTVFVTGGILAAGTTIPVSGSGAQIGDLILVFSPHTAHTLGGTGWTHEDITSGYSGRWSWKILDSTANITCTGNSYSFQWAVYRGPSNAARVFTYQANPPATDWPAPINTGSVTSAGQVMMMWAQSSADAVPAPGFTSRQELYIGGVFRHETHDRLASAQGPALLSSGSMNMLALELRKVVVSTTLADTVGVSDGAAMIYNDNNVTIPDDPVTVTDAASLTLGAKVNFFLLGGGGGGGGSVGGGGGGGQVVTGEVILPNGNTTITIGAGGLGGDGTSTSNWDGKPGNASSIGALVTAVGGGAGGGNPGSIKGLDGAAGGGSAGGTGAGIAFPGGASTIPGGFAGGNGNVGASAAGGGGGGAAQRGNDSTANGGSGGNGVTSSISGAAVQYAGGGGGGIVSGQGSAGSGVFGGSNGSTSTGTAPSATANRGGGGGGGGYNSGRGIGGAGGSGVCIISYPTGSPYNITGGTVTTSGGMTIHTFNSTQTLTVGSVQVHELTPNDSVTVTDNAVVATFLLDLLVVGGGGGGGASTASGGGGGGGGGVIEQFGLTPAIGSYPVVVGAAGLIGGGGNPLVGGDGGSSSALGFTALGGGGGGGSAATAGRNGGNGGGGSGAGASGGTGTAGQGQGGGVGGSGGGGGGGGIQLAGSPAGSSSPGPGGLGRNSSISGTSIGYGWGSGGGSSSTGSGGASGNGGAAGGNNGAAGGAATANRGGGGGGGGQNGAGGAAASGVVIFSYVTGSATCTGGIITTAGGRTIHTFTANGTFQRTA